MIKKITIKNVFGITDLTTINFSLKKTKLREQERELDNGILMVNKEPFMLTPVLIGKNAIGKTSIVNSIQLISELKEVGLYKWLNKKNISRNSIELNLKLITRLISHRRNKESILRFIYNHLLRIDATDKDDMVFDIANNITKKKVILKLKEIQLSLNSIIHTEVMKIINNIKFFYLNCSIETGSISVSFNNTIAKLFISSELIILKANNKVEDTYDYEEKLLSSCSSLLEYICAYIENDEKPLNKINNDFSRLHPLRIYKLRFFTSINDEEIKRSFSNRMCERHSNQPTLSKRIIKSVVESYGLAFIETLLKKIDPSIQRVMPRDGIFLCKNGWNKDPKDLSFGTQKIIFILNKIYTLLINGGICIIDEIENGLNIELIRILVNIFKDDDINIGKAQLILTTHSPAIFEQEVIDPKQAIIGSSLGFVAALELPNRTEDFNSFFKIKNYYNSTYWKKFSNKSKFIQAYNFTNALSNNDMNEILDKISLRVNNEENKN